MVSWACHFQRGLGLGLGRPGWARQQGAQATWQPRRISFRLREATKRGEELGGQGGQGRGSSTFWLDLVGRGGV